MNRKTIVASLLKAANEMDNYDMDTEANILTRVAVNLMSQGGPTNKFASPSGAGDDDIFKGLGKNSHFFSEPYNGGHSKGQAPRAGGHSPQHHSHPVNTGLDGLEFDDDDDDGFDFEDFDDGEHYDQPWYAQATEDDPFAGEGKNSMLSKMYQQNGQPSAPGVKMPRGKMEQERVQREKAQNSRAQSDAMYDMEDDDDVDRFGAEDLGATGNDLPMDNFFDPNHGTGMPYGGYLGDGNYGDDPLSRNPAAGPDGNDQEAQNFANQLQSAGSAPQGGIQPFSPEDDPHNL